MASRLSLYPLVPTGTLLKPAGAVWSLPPTMWRVCGKIAAATTLLLCAGAMSFAQSRLFHRDCGSGQLLVGGTCQEIEAALSASGGRVFWVAQAAANAADSNPGTRSQPWKTIGRAAQELQPGDAVVVRSGVYRETVRPARGGMDAGRRITYAAYTGEQVVVSGAEVQTGWRADGSDWYIPWASLPYNPAGAGNATPGHIMRRELIVFDGGVLLPVPSRAALAAGNFFVDVVKNRLYVRFPGGASPGGHVVEVGKRMKLFDPSSAGYLRLIGFTFRHAVNRAQEPAVEPGRWGGLVEECTVEWTNAWGLAFNGTGTVLRGNLTNDNGQMGYGGACDGCLIEHNRSMRNNWKGYDVSWEAGAGKMAYTTDTVMRFQIDADNNGPGVWFDIHNRENTIDSCWAYRNKGANFSLEFNTTNTVMRNCVAFGARPAGQPGQEIAAGLVISAASNNTIVNCTFFDNQMSGLLIGEDPRAPNGYNKIYNCVFANNGTPGLRGGAQAEVVIYAASQSSAQTNRFDGNLYWHPKGGHFNRTFYLEWPSPSQVYFTSDDLGQWRGLINGDRTSRIADPQLADVTQPTGWRLRAGSPAIGMGVAPSVAVPVDADGDVRPAVGADVGADQFTTPSKKPTRGKLCVMSCWLVDTLQRIV